VGTRVDFALPLTVAGAGAAEDSEPAEAREVRGRLRVLHVEDVPEMQYVVRLYMRDTPHTLECAHTLEAALAAIRAAIDENDPFDVILLDRVCMRRIVCACAV